jgi:Zn finger protein HypA/HybF involved in hydrogenase expression
METKSFQLKMPNCPKCNSEDTKIDIHDYTNLFKIPVATSTSMMIGIPINSISFVCKKCGHKFESEDI